MCCMTMRAGELAFLLTQATSCLFFGSSTNVAPFSLQQSMQNNLQPHRRRSGPIPPPPPPSQTSLLLASFSLPSRSPLSPAVVTPPSLPSRCQETARDPTCRVGGTERGRRQGAMVNGPSERVEEKPCRGRAGAGLLGAGRLHLPLADAVSGPGVLGSSSHKHPAKPGGTKPAPCQQITTRQAWTGLKFWLEILPDTHSDFYNGTLPCTNVQSWKCLQDPPWCRPPCCRSDGVITGLQPHPIPLCPIPFHLSPSQLIISLPHPIPSPLPSVAGLLVCPPADLTPELPAPPPRWVRPRACSPSLGISLARLTHLPCDSPCVQRQSFYLHASRGTWLSRAAGDAGWVGGAWGHSTSPALCAPFLSLKTADGCSDPGFHGHSGQGPLGLGQFLPSST